MLKNSLNKFVCLKYLYMIFNLVDIAYILCFLNSFCYSLKTPLGDREMAFLFVVVVFVTNFSTANIKDGWWCYIQQAFIWVIVPESFLSPTAKDQYRNPKTINIQLLIHKGIKIYWWFSACFDHSTCLLILQNLSYYIVYLSVLKKEDVVKQDI